MPDVADAKAFANAIASDTKFAKGIADDVDLIRIWKANIGEADIDLLKSYRSIPDVIATHLNVRVMSTERKIIGIYGTQIVRNNSAVRIRLLETMVLEDEIMPANTLCSGVAMMEAIGLSS